MNLKHVSASTAYKSTKPEKRCAISVHYQGAADMILRLQIQQEIER